MSKTLLMGLNIGPETKIKMKQELSMCGVDDDIIYKYTKQSVYTEAMINQSIKSVIVVENLELSRPYDIKELEKILDIRDDIRLIVILSVDKKGTHYMQQLLSIGLYNAVFEEDADIEYLSTLLKDGRKKRDAKIYYNLIDVDIDDSNSNSNLVMEVDRVKKLYEYLTSSSEDNEESLEHRVNRIKKSLTDQEFNYLMSRLPNEIVDSISQLNGYENYSSNNMINTDKYVGSTKRVLIGMIKRSTDKFKKLARSKEREDLSQHAAENALIEVKNESKTTLNEEDISLVDEENLSSSEENTSLVDEESISFSEEEISLVEEEGISFSEENTSLVEEEGISFSEENTGLVEEESISFSEEEISLVEVDKEISLDYKHNAVNSNTFTLENSIELSDKNNKVETSSDNMILNESQIRLLDSQDDFIECDKQVEETLNVDTNKHNITANVPNMSKLFQRVKSQTKQTEYKEKSKLFSKGFNKKLEDKNFIKLENMQVTLTIAICSLTKGVGCTHITNVFAYYIQKELKKKVCIVRYVDKPLDSKMEGIPVYQPGDLYRLHELYDFIILDVSEYDPSLHKEVLMANRKLLINLNQNEYIKILYRFIKNQENPYKWYYIFNLVPSYKENSINDLMEDYVHFCFPVNDIYTYDKKIMQILCDLLKGGVN